MYSQRGNSGCSLIQHLFMVEEQPQNAAHSSGLIRFKHICACSHWLSLPSVTALSHARTDAYMPAHKNTHTHTLLSRSLSLSIPSLPPFLPRYISLLSVLHANEPSVLLPEHYRCVCLISLPPFLFPGDYPVFKRNGPSPLHSAPLPTSQPAGQPASERSNLASQHHYHLNVPSEMTAEQGRKAAVCVCARVCVRACVICVCV